MKQQKILLIGGPGTGKSSIISFLEKKGFHCLPEISREVIREAQKKGIEQLFLANPLLFSEMLLQKRIEQFREAESQAQPYVFIDRGIPDVSAYLDYIGNDYPEIFTKTNKAYRYDKIFVLPIWKEIHRTDDERYESHEQAVKIQKFLIATYVDLGYELISVPKTSIEERAAFILKNLGLSI
ncbi:MAG TPA: ATP-binding protein [Flavobacteriaceae bacterium]|nr:ATP-binding protein [Flavobacteriaceae bacterium]